MVEFVQEMQARLDCIGLIIWVHLLTAQEEQQQAYNQPVQPWEFSPGDWVLLLLPNTACKLLAHWQGPYTVIEQVSPVNYCLQQPGKRAEAQLYHMNLLKHVIELATAINASALSLPGPVMPVHKEPELMPAQKQDLMELED